MELSLLKADVLWLAKPRESKLTKLQAPQATRLIVQLPYAEKKDQGVSFPCKILIPVEEVAAKNEASLLEKNVTFKLLDEEEVVATHTFKLRDCIPVLNTGSLHWEQLVLYRDELWNVDICVHLETDRRPRAFVAHAVAVKNGVKSIAHQKNVAVASLLPVVAGCIVGVMGTAPFWLPLTLVVGLMGFPIWITFGFLTAMLVVLSAISAVVTVKLVSSERVKSACQHLLTSQQGQLLLFEGMPGEELLSPSVMSVRAKEFINANPSRKLVASLAIDFLGNATFVVPGLGEVIDVLWAPVSSKMVDALYKESSPRAKYVALMEELLPFTDFIPTAKLAWMKENLSSAELGKLLMLTPSRKQA
ncbi:uncharacterized protein CCR75_003081 [Bremia lactucae]|uniref:Uncharacterized protein n=1 Tax=Bremia lactucae TaxID=4779 RepID=A0A976IKI2_BRELC|nr:hypothetical protein CCR75_003081 [Bremia lactucae]